MVDELERIRQEYARRAKAEPGDFYSVTRVANLFMLHQRERAVLQLLHRVGAIPLAGKAILDVGCGSGLQLFDFERWGAQRTNLAGIDLIEGHVAAARRWFGGERASGERGPDLRVGELAALPWDNDRFDIVYQSVVFTSILDAAMRAAAAREIVRVLKPEGLLIWYDFSFNNPRNPSVRGIGASEIRALFPTCAITFRKITLAPPLARTLVPITWTGAVILERLALLNTHYLAAIRKPLSA